ncbi:hypothetical protein Pmani_018971 [Petrolisthes manimaculis]|uniref:Uncharacterized protein n=1 Tax=Petrolisthes manimaculis TaxID=1843537 RepID=A0AAE1U875_9EUCA|nr:hypothetical protein Pmani_018971 [Petrolisthes manimaculis]
MLEAEWHCVEGEHPDPLTRNAVPPPPLPPHPFPQLSFLSQPRRMMPRCMPHDQPTSHSASSLSGTTPPRLALPHCRAASLLHPPSPLVSQPASTFLPPATPPHPIPFYLLVDILFLPAPTTSYPHTCLLTSSSSNCSPIFNVTSF